MAQPIDRLIELDEQASAKQTERAAFLTLLDAVVEALPDALIVTDVQGDIVLFNAKAEMMFGCHRSDVVGKSVDNLLPERARERHAQEREMYMRFNVNQRSGTMGIGMNLVGLHADGHEFRTEITLARMVVPKGIFILALLRFSPRPTLTQPDETAPVVGVKDPDAGI